MWNLTWISLALLAFFTMQVTALTDTQKSMIQSKLMSGGIGCLKEHPLSLSDISSFRNKMVPDGANAKCFAECLFKKIGIMDDMGKLSVKGAKDSAMKIFKNNDDNLKNVDEIVNKCSSVNEHDINETGMKECDRAKLVFKCLVENAPKFGFDMDF